MAASDVAYRPATDADTRAINEVGERAFDDLALRHGWSDTPIDEAGIERELEAQRSLYRHLAETSDQFWAAERQGRVVGVARSIVRGQVRELTELFVLPEAQGIGIGGELLRRAFPMKTSGIRCVLSTPDLAALACYLHAGFMIRFPNYGFAKPPEDAPRSTDLDFWPLTASEEMLHTLDQIDDVVLGHRRTVDHRWLVANRPGWLYQRNGQPAGYGYAGRQSGPFALLDPADFPAVLAHAEGMVARAGHDTFGVVAPMVNETVIAHLLGRDFRLDPFFSYLMSDKPFGRFAQYIETTPTFFL